MQGPVSYTHLDVYKRQVLLRAGGLLFHQPAETFGMRPVGEVPPDVLRLDFLCTQAGMDRFRGAVFHAEPQMCIRDRPRGHQRGQTVGEVHHRPLSAR